MTEYAKTLDALSCPTPIASHESVLLGHGSGGKLSAELPLHPLHALTLEEGLLARAFELDNYSSHQQRK